MRKEKSSTLLNGWRDRRTSAAIFRANARNFANDEKGYRTVKIAAALMRATALVLNFSAGGRDNLNPPRRRRVCGSRFAKLKQLRLPRHIPGA
jgi:hypothetical protein